MTLTHELKGHGAGRTVLMVVHTGKEYNRTVARQVASELLHAGVTVRVLDDEAEAFQPCCFSHAVPSDGAAAAGAEVVLVLGGDGTVLRAAELAHPAEVPVFGINLGRVGFLPEAEADDVHHAVARVIRGDYWVDERMTLEIIARLDGSEIGRTWALNEASVEKSSRERILEVVIEVDGRPVSGFGCDGVLCATPTGSTAYAFSAGGPIVWPDVEAVLLVPSNAHALFSRPLLVAPDSPVAIEVDPHGHPAVMCSDGRRTMELPAGARIEITTGPTPVRFVRLSESSFADRLVNKFSLPVQSWRGPAEQ